MAEPRRPKYLEIKEDLARRIQAKEFVPGRALPSQAKLSSDYGVTLMTLRQALRGLQDENLIVQQRGRGTFVTPAPPTLDLRSLSSLADDMDAQGVQLSTEVLSISRRVLPAAAASELGRDRGERGVRLERLRRIGQRPVVHQISWIPQPWGDEVRATDFSTESLYSSLRNNCSIIIANAHETLQAKPMSAELARVSGTAVGRPVMVAERTTYDTQRLPVVFDIATIFGEGFRITVERTQSDVRMSWVSGVY